MNNPFVKTYNSDQTDNELIRNALKGDKNEGPCLANSLLCLEFGRVGRNHRIEVLGKPIEQLAVGRYGNVTL